MDIKILTFSTTPELAFTLGGPLCGAQIIESNKLRAEREKALCNALNLSERHALYQLQDSRLAVVPVVAAGAQFAIETKVAKNRRLAFDIDPDSYAQLENLANSQGAPLALLGRQAIKQYLERENQVK